MTCPLCNCDPDAPVYASWSITFNNEQVPSQNRLSRGMRNYHIYSKFKKRWELLVKEAMLTHGVSKATGRRRIRFTRRIPTGRATYDLANMVGGLKPVVDAMQEAGLLKNDSPNWFEGHYKQEVAKGEPYALSLLVEDLQEPSE